MDAAIPPEFETLARELVAAGTFASIDEAVAAALRNEVAQIEDLRTEIRRGIASLDRGEGRAGEAAMLELIAATRTRYGG